MSAARLYCRGGCSACAAISHALVERGVDVHVQDVITDPDAYEAVIALGYRSLPVLVASDGTSAAGAGASELARRLVVTSHASVAPHRDPANGTSPISPIESLAVERRHARRLVPSRTDRGPRTGEAGDDA